MDEPWLRVIADDLTGACDVGAALLPHRGPILVESIERIGDGAVFPAGALVVRNTQSRTLTPALAAARVARALGDAPQGRCGVVVKKIDTALRGSLGAEIDAAMETVGAGIALVLAAIPEVGRATVEGRQLIDGVPVAETAFAHDPQNPVRDSSVATVITTTSGQRVCVMSVAEMRRDGSAAAIAARRAEGWTIMVGDATSDADLDDWLAGLPSFGSRIGREPVVLVGSTGLAKAWRRRTGSPDASQYGAQIRRVVDPMRGVLIVSGSAHPTTRAQLEYARQQGSLVLVVPALDAPHASAIEVAQCLAQGQDVCLSAPIDAVPGGSSGVLDALASAAAAALERVRPAAMILIGGETAFHVLGRLDHPRLIVEGEPAPLAVRAVVADGPHAGMAMVTKGGSSGPPDRLRALIMEARR